MYDRIFDSGLFAQEILSGKFEDMNLLQLLKMMYQMPSDKIGKVFVKYDKPIEIFDYLAKNNQLTFDEMTHKFTKELYLFHGTQQPIT